MNPETLSKPHSLARPNVVSTVSLQTPEERFAALGPHTRRHGRVNRDANGNKIPFPETWVPACPPVRMADLPKGFIPARFYEKNLEQNQLVMGCCRHPENHVIWAEKSHPDEKAPDRYFLRCNCGAVHKIFCAGAGDAYGVEDHRPQWKSDYKGPWPKRSRADAA